MVYLRKILIENSEKLSREKNIEWVAYLYVRAPADLTSQVFELTPEEEVALKGYKSEVVETESVTSIVSRSPIKGIGATSNVYKFAGLYLAAKKELRVQLNEKFQKSDLKQQYFLSKVEPQLQAQLRQAIKDLEGDPIADLINAIFNKELVKEASVISALQRVTLTDVIDVQLQLILEDFEASLLTVMMINKSADEVVRDVMTNFSNAIQKIVRSRRKGHNEFEIHDEYDVQDILYVILKSLFPNLKDEDPIPKVGGKSTKIDLILRDERILIEVKMIKSGDSNENKFIEELKTDFESYHECEWLDKLFCFVYDPFKKTRDIQNFKDLNGDRTKSGHSYNVEVIVSI